MIDLTPLDVRKKLGDFGKSLRGYDPQEVDTFLELVAERMEVLVKEILQLRDRGDHLEGRVAEQEGREKAIQEALVTAQTLREDVKQQAEREGDLLQREAQAGAERVLESAQSDAQRVINETQGRVDLILSDAMQVLSERRSVIEELERRRHKLLKALRSMLERELDEVEVEEGRPGLDMSDLDIMAAIDTSITSISDGSTGVARDTLSEEESGVQDIGMPEADSVITPIDKAPSFNEGEPSLEEPSLDMMEGTTDVIGLEEAEEAGEDVEAGVPTLDEILDEAGEGEPSAEAVEESEQEDESDTSEELEASPDEASPEDEASPDEESKTHSLWLSALRRDRSEADQDT